MANVTYRESLPDGTIKLWMDDNTTQIVGTPMDPVERARQAGQASAAQTQAIYGDPWYAENVLDPMNRSSEAASKERAATLRNQGRQLEIQGRTAEANEKYQQAQIELRKAELKQQAQLANRGYDIQERGQGLQAQQAAGQLFMQGAKPAYASQYIDLMRRAPGLQAQTGSFSDILAGRLPSGAFGVGTQRGGTTVNDVLFGNGGGVTQDALAARNEADKGLATGIARGVGHLQRGSLESLDPYEREYLGSQMSSVGYDPGVFERAYKRAGIMQGPGSRS